MIYYGCIVHNFSYFQGLNILIPVVDSIKYVQVLKEIAIEVPEQHAITSGMPSVFF